MQNGIIYKGGIPYGTNFNVYDTQPISQIVESDAESISGYIKLTDERQSLLKTNYPELYDKIGNKYGGDDTHFNIPSLVDVDEHYYDDDGWVDISSQLTFTNVTDLKVRALRCGHTASLAFHGTYTGGQSTSTKLIITGLPSKYIPKYNGDIIDSLISFPLTAYNSSQYTCFGRAFFYSDGRICVGESNMVNPSSVRASVTYIV